MIAALIALALLLAPCQAEKDVSAAQKREFLEVLKTLPHKGEFYTDEGVAKAKPYLPVLLALTEQDIKGYDIYPFAALSNGLGEYKDSRGYVVRHFEGIRHPVLQLGWAVMLFEKQSASPQVMQFLRDALMSNKQAKLLKEMLGPGFADFQRRVKAHPTTKKQSSHRRD